MANQNFTDSKGRQWLIDYDYADTARIFKATGFNLCKILDPNESARIDGNPDLFLSILFEIVRKQAMDRNIDLAEFKSGFGKNQDIALAAGEALSEAARLFCPSQHQGRLAELRTKAQAFQTAAMLEADKLLAEMDPQKMAAAQFQVLRKQIGATSFLNAPASSESHPSSPD